MIGDQLLSTWAWCLTSGAQNPTKPNEFAYVGGPYPRKWSNMMDFVVGWQLLLTPWLLSTWFGDWLASQSPSPSWQHRVSLKHLHNTVILCQFLLLLGMLCHMGGWDMVAYTWSTSHITCPRSDNTHGIIDNSGVGTVGQTSSKNSDFANQILFVGGCHILGGVCQLVCLGRILQERHEKSEQPNCPTSWD